MTYSHQEVCEKLGGESIYSDLKRYKDSTHSNWLDVINLDPKRVPVLHHQLDESYIMNKYGSGLTRQGIGVKHTIILLKRCRFICGDYSLPPKEVYKQFEFWQMGNRRLSVQGSDYFFREGCLCGCVRAEYQFLVRHKPTNCIIPIGRDCIKRFELPEVANIIETANERRKTNMLNAIKKRIATTSPYYYCFEFVKHISTLYPELISNGDAEFYVRKMFKEKRVKTKMIREEYANLRERLNIDERIRLQKIIALIDFIYLPLYKEVYESVSVDDFRGIYEVSLFTTEIVEKLFQIELNISNYRIAKAGKKDQCTITNTLCAVTNHLKYIILLSVLRNKRISTALLNNKKPEPLFDSIVTAEEIQNYFNKKCTV